ncbi:MAG: nucleotidyltransferase family protein [Candidatus Hadarchaeota archaeon]
MKSTIKLSAETKKMLEELKLHLRETYEDVLRRLISEKGGASTSQMLEQAVQYLKKRGVRNIAVFGSRARGDAKPGSDLDLLVDMPEGTSLIDHVGMEMELFKLLGVKVELVPRDAVSPYMRESIENEAVAVE